MKTFLTGLVAMLLLAGCGDSDVQEVRIWMKQIDAQTQVRVDRRKELLESYPLDTIRMVGTIEKKGVVHAVLQVDRAVHQVVVGQHLGQNDGRITSISENAVTLKEIVQDATGDWVERQSRLELQESKENTK
jgi:type IV pilus assembly protein PilP